MAIQDSITGPAGAAAQPAPSAAPQQAAAPEAAGAEGGGQEAYERFVLAGVQALSDPASNPSIMKMLADEGIGEPAKRLAGVTSTIVGDLVSKAKGDYPKDVVIPAAGEILMNVADFADQSGTFTVDEPMVGRASQMLISDLTQNLGLPLDEPEDLDEEQLATLTEEQSAIAQSAPPATGAPAAAPAAPAAPAQNMPGIVNRTIGT